MGWTGSWTTQQQGQHEEIAGAGGILSAFSLNRWCWVADFSITDDALEVGEARDWRIYSRLIHRTKLDRLAAASEKGTNFRLRILRLLLVAIYNKVIIVYQHSLMVVLGKKFIISKLSNDFHGFLPKLPGRIPRCVFVLVEQILQCLNILGMPLDQYLTMFIQWSICGSVNLRKKCGSTQVGRRYGFSNDNHYWTPSRHDTQALEKDGTSGK